ncbi:NAD(P)-dependent alcohol dehydrogenase [Paenibacillus polymyxa]|uniref:NAD(P)-dependent alcohol dehydrogenase n=1 Tax=Paenibacillus polymyxa TaxID=1406 RepID=A0AAE9IFG8_PAEPO|nr:NAD(P)-dependent alcohol dehydrogenase [Paenibacillus polymyxa]URJ39955.1 NAD(P)-dependent alcohol dehydrogenase [Paenibacillus polymyxa]URJ49198.1 NAD(P)-dependent alcohol dehydrogenase [Paenibacillus polymyxa]
MKIQAVVQQKPGEQASIKNVELSVPRADEVLVKIVASGICHTDLYATENSTYYPIVLGHEGSGIIESIGSSVNHLQAGDHVVLSYTYCGTCMACLEGRTYECDQIYQNFEGLREDQTSPISYNEQTVAALIRQGSFASHVICHKNSVVKVEKDLDLHQLGPLGCGFMTGAGSILNYLKPKCGNSMVIIGAGSVGLAAVMAAKIAGCNPIIALDQVAFKLDTAKGIGATHCINGATSEDVSRDLLEISNGIDYIFDTTGNEQVLNAVQKVMNPGASGCGVGGNRPHLTDTEINEGKTWGEVDEGAAIPQVFIPQLIQYARDGEFPFAQLIRYFPLEEVHTAMDLARQGKIIKPVLIMP